MRGADEAIDSLMRAFCVPAVDNIIVCPPTFAMYRQSAILQGVEVREAPLAKGFALDTDAVLSAVDDNTKLVFVCSPNNPTANLMDRQAVEELCVSLAGRALVVVDETYVEYAGVDSMAEALERFENLVVRTLSESHALLVYDVGLPWRAPISASCCARCLRYPIPQPVVQAVLAIMAPGNQQSLGAARRGPARCFCAAAGEQERVGGGRQRRRRAADADALAQRYAAPPYILRAARARRRACAVKTSIGTEDGELRHADRAEAQQRHAAATTYCAPGARTEGGRAARGRRT